MKNIFLFTSAFFLSSFCSAEELCFANKTEYEAIKNRLPELLQQVPVFFSAKTKVLFVEVMAAAYVQFDSAGRVRFFFNCTHEVDKPIEETVSVCVDLSSVTFTFDNKKTEKVVLKTNNEVRVRNKLNIKKTSKDEFSKMAKAIEEKLRGSNSQSSSSGNSSSQAEGTIQ